MPAEAVAAPPAAPAATPAPSSAPPKRETPFNDPFAGIDELFRDAPEEKPAEKTSPAKAEKPAPAKVAEKTEDKPEAKPVEKPEQKGKGWELRTKYEETAKRVKELEAELEKRKQPAEDPEKKTLAERLEQVEKRRVELEDEIRFAAYERSQEYKDKFQAPLERALKSAYEDVGQLTITDANGNESKGTEAHFNALCRMTVPQAIAQAKEWFGDTASEVLAMRRHILELRDQAQGAIEQFRKDGTERERQRADATAREVQEQQQAWKTHIQQAFEKHPEYFQPADDDAKGKEILTKGMTFADQTFTGRNKIPRQQIVGIDAAVRNMAGAFPYIAYKWRAAEKRVQELESKLKEFEASEPGEGGGARVPKETGGWKPGSWESEIDELPRA